MLPYCLSCNVDNFSGAARVLLSKYAAETNCGLCQGKCQWNYARDLSAHHVSSPVLG